jgi:hypothetical protein
MNIYTITVVAVQQHGINGPLYGVHSSKRKALHHFNIIKEDRIKRGAELFWDNWDFKPYPGEQYRFDVRKAYWKNPDGSTEEFSLEKWRV